MDTVVVTTCSVNHLAQAKSLGDSLAFYNPSYKLMIGLADKLPEGMSKDAFSPFEIVEVHDLNIPQFNEMYERYNTFELNCALKSFFLAYAMEQYRPDHLIFMDSDMLAFASMTPVNELLNPHSILLTPHIFSPFPMDGNKPKERDILKAGIYNAGFLGLKNDETGNSFLKWWTTRMVDQCYEKPKWGLVVDQNWLNLVPVYFNNVKVVQHRGWNVAYWNLHERALEKKGTGYIVNGSDPLLFFHFSGYNTGMIDSISRHQNRYTMNEFPAVKELFGLYHDKLIKNGHADMVKLPCYYQKKKTVLQKLGLKK
jgi:hypothetical protein